MKKITTIGRILFAIPFALFGINHFLMTDYYLGMLTSFHTAGGIHDNSYRNYAYSCQHQYNNEKIREIFHNYCSQYSCSSLLLQFIFHICSRC